MNIPNADEKLNCYKLSCLILDVGTYTLQSLFEKTYSTTDLQTFLNSKQGKLSKLSRRNVINQDQKERLQPSNGTNPVLKDFDISLVSILLTNICSIAKPSGGWAVPPASDDTSIGADILRLKKARNGLYAHRTHSSMDDATFKKEWKEIVGSVTRLSTQLEIQEQRAIIDKIEEIYTTRINCYQRFQTTLDEILHRLEKIEPNTPDEFSSDDEDDAVDAVTEIPQGPDGVITVLMEYPKLKSELSKDSGEKIAKYLQTKKLINRDQYEKIKDSSRTRRVCIDRLLKMVVEGSPELLECFFNQLREHCPRLAIALSKRKVTEDDRKKYKENEKASDDVNRIRRSHIVYDLDVIFFQRYLRDSPEIVDDINDELLSTFIFSTWEHTSVTYCEDLNDMILTLFETMHSCHLQLESVLEKKLRPALLNKWTDFKNSTLHIRVLEKYLPVLEKDLNVDKVFTHIRENQLLDDSSCIDISRQKNKSEQWRMIVHCLKKKDRSVYEKFKECLDLSGQSRLKNALEEEEKNHFPKTSEQSSLQRKWKAFLQFIHSATEYIKQLFLELKMKFITAHIGSIILIFGASMGFDVKLLNQRDLRIPLETLIRHGCAECNIKIDGPVYVTVCIVSPGYDGRDMDIQFYLDFEAFLTQRKSKENRECHELKLLEEELNPSQLQRWILDQPQIGRDIKEKIENSVSNKFLSRREKMIFILDNIITLENWRGILEQFCERNDRYVYDKMLRESDQMSSQEGIGISPNLSYKRGGGLQELYSMWININEDQWFPEEDLMGKAKLCEERQTEKFSPGDDNRDIKYRDYEANARLTTEVHEEDHLEKENVIEECSEMDRILVAAIDIGTTYSGYAFSFKYEYDMDPAKISINQEWGFLNISSPKTLTSVLCDPTGEFVAFGYDAEENYSKLTEDDAPQKWYIFRRFKMALYQKQIQRGFEVEDVKGLKMPGLKIFGMAIRYLKDDLLRTLNWVPNADSIHWILTVPAIWTDSAKQFMREAANEAGIDGKNLTIALEPEAAAMHYQLTPSDCLPSIGRSDDSKYMIIDIGGETVDITVHMIRADGTMNVVHKASSRECGGNKVDEEFNQFLINLFGNPVLETFCKLNMHDYMEMREEFERTKRLLCTYSNAKVSISVPVSLINMYETLHGETILKTTFQSPHEGKFEWESNKIVLDADLFQSFFQTCISKITEYIAEILNMTRVTGTSTFLIVGGFSECQIIQEAVRKAFPTVKVVKPVEAELAVLRGAVMLGHMMRKPFDIASTSST